MRVKGTEEWQGTRSNPVTLTQCVYLDILKEMTGNEFYARNSKEAYGIIGEYKSDLEDCVQIKYDTDCDDPYLLYGDVYIDDQYRFTTVNRCADVVSVNDSIDDVEILSYETYIEDYL